MPTITQVRYKRGRTSRVDPKSDQLLNMSQVGFRWGVTGVCARNRLEQHGIPLVRFSRTSCSAWLSDVRALEEKFTVSPRSAIPREQQEIITQGEG
jgi:hypothetical protein